MRWLDEGLSPGFSIDCTSHFTAWPPLAPRALAGGEGGGGGEGADRAHSEGWIDDCRVMIVEF